MYRLAGLIAVALLTGTLAAGIPAGAALVKATPSSPITVTFDARMSSSPWRAIAGEYAGTLRLRINPDGVLSGWYRPSTGGGFDMVNGGLQEDGKMWLTIGLSAPIYVNGIYESGRINGSASGSGVTWLTFSAIPVK